MYTNGQNESLSKKGLQGMKKKILVIILLTVTGISVNAQQNVPDSLEHQNLQRQYMTHLPPGYNNDHLTPAVIVLHGGSGNYQSVQGFTQMNVVSNENDFLVVYPQGIGNAPPGYSWADGRNTTADQAGIDDIGFISRLIDTMYQDYNIDTNRVYICGFSNGGFMTQRLACESPERFAAIGGLGCSMDTNLIQTCNPDREVPMAYFSGTADPEVPYQGGAMNNPAVTPIVAVDTAVQYWVNNNQCKTAEPVVNIPDTVQRDSSTVELYKFTNCDCDADVYFYKIINGGHTWPGVPVPLFPQLGNANEDIHASYLLWDFFRQYSQCRLFTGISEDEKASEYLAFPNPTNDWIKIKSEEKIYSVSLFDMEGRMKFQQKNHVGMMDLSSLSPGIYLLRVELANGLQRSSKIVKE